MKSLKHNFLAAAAYGRALPAKKLRSGLFVVAAFAGLAGLIALTDPSQTAAGPGPSNVVVVNTPLPISPTGTQTVAGTVNVGNFPGTQAVTVGNTPNVNVANMPTMELDPSMIVAIPNTANKALLIRDTDNPARQPVHHAMQCFMQASNSCFDPSPYTVPSGKELVIESVSAEVQLPTTQKVTFLFFFTTVGNSNVPMSSAPSYQTDDGTFANFVVSQQMRMYADPTTSVSIVCNRNSTLGNGECLAQFSGYLVDVP